MRRKSILDNLGTDTRGALYSRLTYGQYHRWGVNSNKWLPMAFATVPSLLRGLIGSTVRSSVMDALNKQGYGRHSRDELDVIALDGALSIDAASLAECLCRTARSQCVPW
jgi:hypothetical protein